MPRVIRLKEYPPSTRIVVSPPDWYVAQKNSSFLRKNYVINTDENGFIKSGLESENQDGSIIVLGDSVVEGLYVDETLRMCSALASVLSDELGYRIDVLNGGYSGATLLHSFNVFLNKVVPLKPMAVIVMTGIVDADVALRRASFWSNDQYIEPVVSTERANSYRDNDTCPRPNLDDRLGMLSMFDLASRAFDVPVWFATVPHLQIYAGDWVKGQVSDRGKFEELVDLRRKINGSTRSFCIKNDVRLFDLEIALMHRDEIFYDMFHFNSDGGLVAARAMIECGLADALRDCGLVPHPRAETG